MDATGKKKELKCSASENNEGQIFLKQFQLSVNCVYKHKASNVPPKCEIV